MEQQVQLPSKMWVVILFITALGCQVKTEKQSIGNDFTVPATDSRIKNLNGTIYFKNQLFTGKLFTLFPATNDTAETACYINGKEHGEWKKFYRLGTFKEKRKFENGKKAGELISWWPNGNKQMFYPFLNNEYEGTCREWAEDGTLIKEMNYTGGHEEGMQQCWYDNGKVKANYIIKNGRRYGLLGTKNCINVPDSIFKN